MKTYLAYENIPMYRLVTPGEKNTVKLANSSVGLIFGASDDLGTKGGEPIDICHFGYTQLTYGATLLKGEPFTSDTEGRAVKAHSADSVAGFALEAGKLGDICQVVLIPTQALSAP